MHTKKSYGEILKSSSIMGGAAVFTMLFGMIRTKFAAIYLGSMGVGVIASYTAIQGLIGIIAGLGIQSSAVREIVVATGKSDARSLGRVVLTVRRVCWLTGLVGMLTMIMFSPLLSRLTFNSETYTLDIAALGIVIFLNNLSGWRLALLQGMRRISEMARVNVIGAVLSMIIAIAFYHVLGLRGVVPSLVFIAAMQLIIAWRFTYLIPVPLVTFAWKDSLLEAKSMVKMGFVLMWNGLLVSAVGYFTIYLITNNASLHAVGLYSAAFMLSGISVNFILGAMAADYYPRLTSVAHDDVLLNRLTNEQTEIGVLLALPGLLGTLVLAPMIINVFYSSEFLGAINLLQWFVVGCLARVISWPLGFIILALGKGRWFLLTETSGNFAHLALLAIGLRWFDVEGIAIAFFVVNFIYIAAVYLVCRNLTGFGWSNSSRQILLFALVITILIFIGCRVLPIWFATLVGLLMTIGVGIFCLRELTKLLGSDHTLVKFISSLPGAKLLINPNK